MDKLAELLKATIAVFHGIIATWLFLDFSERKVSEFYFLVLLVFFSVANVLVWSFFVRLFKRRRTNFSPIPGIEHVSFRSVDVVGLTVVAAALGLFAAFLDRKEVVLTAANFVSDWHRTTSDSPFDSMILNLTSYDSAAFDKRSRRLVQSAKEKGSYLRIIPKGSRLAYEGYPGLAPTKGEVADRELVLTPACRLTYDSTDPAKIISTQRIEGPGVFLRLPDVTAIEIIDVAQSQCADVLNAP
jgi:hypothetical protein